MTSVDASFLIWNNLNFISMRIGFDRRSKRDSNLEIVEIDDAIIHDP